MNGALSDMAGDIGFRIRTARAVARQIDELILPPVGAQLGEQRNDASYLLAAVCDLLDLASASAEGLEVELKAGRGRLLAA